MYRILSSTNRRLNNISRQFSSNTALSTDKFNYNRSSLSFDDDSEKQSFKRVTASDLLISRSHPTSVQMLTRDFIDNSLYNPHYGYFSKQAVIFSPSKDHSEKPLDFRSLRSTNEFEASVARRYAEYGMEEGGEGSMGGGGPGRQVWHTPVELFQVSAWSMSRYEDSDQTHYLKPWYGYAIAQCLISEYLLKHFPYEDLIIYEMGGGNGTLAQNILTYIQNHYPDVYDRTKYRIIEISENLANVQRATLAEHLKEGTLGIVNKSVFEWNEPVLEPCFFLALEVIVRAAVLCPIVSLY